MTRIVLVLIAVGVLCTVVMVLLMLGSDLAARRAKRPDPVEQHYADTVGIAVDVEPAPADEELPEVDPADVTRLVIDLYGHLMRQHHKGIYGEDGQP